MQTKHLFVLIDILNKDEVGTIKPEKIVFTDRSKGVLLLWVNFVINVSYLSCFLVLWSSALKEIASWLSNV